MIARPRTTTAAGAVVLVLAVTAVLRLVTTPDGRRELPFARGLPARSADAVVESIGVNTHLHYDDTSYADFDAVERALLDLGIRHIRDYPVPDSVPEFQRLARHGISLTAIMGTAAPRQWMPHSTAALLGATAEIGAGVAALEGANEWDISDDPAWRANVRRHQHALWELARASGRSAPVFAPSMTWADNMAELGDLSTVADAGNIHPYPGGRPPEARVAQDLRAARRHVVGPKAVVATETGYHDAVGAGRGHAGVDRAVAAAYVPRLVLHYFDIGIARAYLYELVDQDGRDDRESAFGLLDEDFVPKPAYHTLRQLVQVLADPGEPFDAGHLEYRLRRGGADIKHVLLQKRDGTFYLAIWRAVSIWDPVARATRPAPSVDVTIVVSGRIERGRVLSLDPEGLRVRSIVDTDEIEIAVTPSVQLVELEPHGFTSSR